MAKLPFKVAPKKETVEIGNDKIGIIELPQLGDITVREQTWINEQMAQKSTFLEIARIANKIAKAQKIDPVAAHRFLTVVVSEQLQNITGISAELTDKQESWKIKYAREIEELVTFLLSHQWEKQTVTAAALIRFRVEGMEDYTVDDARELSQQLINLLFGFAMLEQGAGGESEEVSEADEERELREELGK